LKDYDIKLKIGAIMTEEPSRLIDRARRLADAALELDEPLPARTVFVERALDSLKRLEAIIRRQVAINAKAPRELHAILYERLDIEIKRRQLQEKTKKEKAP